MRVCKTGFSSFKCNIVLIPSLITGIILLVLVSQLDKASASSEELSKYNSKGVNLSRRESRAVYEVYLTDPLDCLSQLVCGLNTFPPQTPSARTTTANDYAYLLQNVLIRLKKQVNPRPRNATTTTTSKPETLNDDDEDDEDEEEDENLDDDIEDVESEEEETPEEKKKKKLLKNSKDQKGDIVEMKGLYPPFGLIDFYRKGRARKSPKPKKSGRKTSKNSKNKSKDPLEPSPTPMTLTPLEQLQIEQDVRSKLRSNARCLYGIMQHSCPFKYTELMILMSAILERQKVMSYTSNRILPMVGYLLKSRSLTQTLKATFMSLEKINNITISKNKAKEPFTFSHVYDEIIHGETGGNGLNIIETTNDATSAGHSWEDDEFDAALRNPFLPKDKIPGFAIKDRSKNKKKQQQEDSEEGDNDSGDEDGGRIPESESPFLIGDIAGFPNRPSTESESDEDDEKEVEIQDVPLPSVYGIDSKNQKFRNLLLVVD